MTSSQEKYLISHRGSAELVWAVTGGGAFSNADHLWTLSEERHDGKKERDGAYTSKLKGLVRNLKCTDKCLFLRSKIIGDWLSVRGTKDSVTVLSATEFWYFYCACYNISPLNIQNHCNGYGTAFVVMHTLSWIIGGLVIARDNSFIYLNVPSPQNL